jgi:uncharacterized protein
VTQASCSSEHVVRSALIGILLSLALSASATTRYVTDRAASPVRWVEWGKYAFERAKKEQRPLFVSIGFASSWDCQRMHREAFLNGENAEALNAYFVPVLLDRIEYPEVAEAYEATQAGEGWPVNLILTPELEPFAGARFMNTAELNRMLVINANRWASERAAVIAEARAAKTTKPRPSLDVDSTTIERVVDDIARTFEKTKTLDATEIAFLLRYAARTKHENIRALAIDTLRSVAAGPLRDQLGGGFHRCATCYDKLLADQALFALAYLDGFQIARDPDLAHVARTTIDYVLRDLVPPRGLFQSAQDGHSLVPGQGPVFVEGAFYVWTRAEITRLLGNDAAGKVFKLYGLQDGERLVLEDPRFLHETHDELAAPLQKLLDVRQQRPAPFREVPMAGSNGLMISALARAAAVLNQPEYLQAATNAATLISTRLWNAQKKTLERNESHTPALPEDYAMLVQGLLDLFDRGHDPKWLELAMTLQQRQDQLFWDGAQYGADEETNAIAAINLLRLATLTGNEQWRARPATIFRAFGGVFGPELAAAYEMSLIAPSIVVVIGDAREVPALHDRWEPMRAVIFVPRRGVGRERLVKMLPFVGGLAVDPQRTITYVCANGECRSVGAPADAQASRACAPGATREGFLRPSPAAARDAAASAGAGRRRST